MIDITKLTEKDIGKFVEYDDGYEKKRGRIKSFRDDIIFVVYHCGNDWNNYKNYTAAGTQPQNLTFMNFEL